MAGVNKDLITPVVIGKLSAGLLALLAGAWVSKELSSEIDQSEAMAAAQLISTHGGEK